MKKVQNKLPHGGDGLSVTEPKVDLQLLATIDLSKLNIDGKVLERSVQRTSGASDGDLAGLGTDSDCN